MAEFKIFFKKSVEKDLKGIPGNYLAKILGKIELLKENPRPEGSEKLTGKELYRIRQGIYRIVYSIQDTELTIWVVKIGHRKEIYKKIS
ncbi:MAG: type II toxin-antitoxin system mRNA interferase toxin, RelE/StbE family [Desulfobulbus propionicus]|nr:MAG: type II toxin-antitoxin system mRNA interferase toxin, RelE/StbE family [Desulfobulbus propionicus]